MKVAIYFAPSFLGGGEVRTLEVASRFPRDRYVLLMPRNLKAKALNDASRLGLREDLINILRDAHELDDYISRDPLYSIIYRRRVERAAERLGADLLYAPVGALKTGFFVGHCTSPVRWARLLQASLPVGSLVTEEGDGLRLFLKVAALNGIDAATALGRYVRLTLNSRAALGVLDLAVTAAIPYEFNKVGIRIDATVLNPGNGVEGCPYVGLEKAYDVIFHARIERLKGVFDFIAAVKGLAKLKKDVRAVVVGSASKEMAKEVMSYAADLGVVENIEFRFNASSDEVLRLLASSKAFIYPTRSDAFPLVVLESLSCATPVVAYDIPAIRFNYAGTRAVIRVRPLDVKGLVEETFELLRGGDWDRLGREGVEFSKGFTWDNVARAEWSSLERIANEG
ncbi:MAG: Glycosyltransferase [uncultured Acidilobus sp. MG]|nr:MAG: Glycosyltransferase [uncultured Acidilobus sp. MG]